MLKQKGRHDVTAKHRELCVGDYVFVRNYGPGGKWLPGVIVGENKLLLGIPTAALASLSLGAFSCCHQSADLTLSPNRVLSCGE